MSWREAYRLSSVAFAELSLQAIYGFRQGNFLPGGSTAELPAKARSRVRQSKALVGALLGLVALGAGQALRFAGFIALHAVPVPISIPVFQTGVLSALVALDVAFLWWTGLQVIPTFLSSGVLPVLEPLPIDDRTLRRTAGLLYLRLFDYPILAVLVVTPLAVGFALGWVAGLAILPGLVASIAFALALSLITGRFFVRRVQGSRGGGGQTVLRWAYLILWVIPAFGLFGLLSLAPTFFTGLADAAASAPSPAFDLVLSVFPVALAGLPSLAAYGSAALPLGGAGAVVIVAAVGAYGMLAVGVASWLGGAVRSIAATPPGVPVPAGHRPIVLRPTGSAFAVLVKDLRIASRTPGYAFLILLPILDALALGLLTVFGGRVSGGADGIALGAVTTAALLATFFGPAFFSIEVVAYSYGRTLPLSDRSLVLGKVALVAGMYLTSVGVVLAIADLRLSQPLVFVGFSAVELPAVLAASFLELGILLHRARRKGLPLVNLYSGAFTALLVSIPGLVVAGAPLVVFEVLRTSSVDVALALAAPVAVAELAIAAPFALRRGGH
jgi:hypothetical protein